MCFHHPFCCILYRWVVLCVTRDAANYDRVRSRRWVTILYCDVRRHVDAEIHRLVQEIKELLSDRFDVMNARIVKLGCEGERVGVSNRCHLVKLAEKHILDMRGGTHDVDGRVQNFKFVRPRSAQ